MRNKKSYSKKKLSSGGSPLSGLKPLRPLDLSKVKRVDDLVRQMSFTSFGGRAVGEAADVLYKMTEDKDCFIVLTLSGALTVAKMGLVISDMIDSGMVGAVITTGALIVHSLVEAAGMPHFKDDRTRNDEELYRTGYDRVYDTLESERNLKNTEDILRTVLAGISKSAVISSKLISERLGRYMAGKTDRRSILKSAFLKKVPIFIPAYTDSELGLDFGAYNRMLRLEKRKTFRFDPFLDLEDFAGLVKAQKRIGIFTVGGGVPRNWAQQIAPYLGLIGRRLKRRDSVKRYHYGVRICPEPVHWGGLSGSTYSEGVSWGKLLPPSEGGRWAEVYADATIALPLIVKAVLERLSHNNRRG